jgi:hypothetical protein
MEEANPKTPARRTCTIPEAGEVLGLSRESAYKAANTGEIYTLKIGRRNVVPLAWLERKLSGEAAA